MPVVAQFDGIKIEFYPSEHPPPHFHARYAEHAAQVRIDPIEVIEGSLPPPVWKKVREWAKVRQGPLMAAWIASESKLKPGRIA